MFHICENEVKAAFGIFDYSGRSFYELGEIKISSKVFKGFVGRGVSEIVVNVEISYYGYFTLK